MDRLAGVRTLARRGEARTLRLDAGLSLADVAPEIGVDPSTLARWERGAARPHRDAAFRWEAVLARLALVGRPHPGVA